MKNFALVGVGGYIAPRHLRAIRDTGNNLVACLDIHDSVGILDSYFPDTIFFNSPERFERFLQQTRLRQTDYTLDYLTVCSPNYLHDSHIRMGLYAGLNVICEKPLTINIWNLDFIEQAQKEAGLDVNVVLQLRLQPNLMELKQQVEQSTEKYLVDLTYVTKRGNWYDISWKGDEEQSGGVAMNIGVHFFDLCLWMFGSVQENTVYLHEDRRMSGVMELEQATVRWYLSINEEDLPAETVAEGKHAYRSMTINGEELEFSTYFTDLHTRTYEEILAGRGFTITDARPSIEAVHEIRTSPVAKLTDNAHPRLLTTLKS